MTTMVEQADAIGYGLDAPRCCRGRGLALASLTLSWRDDHPGEAASRRRRLQRAGRARSGSASPQWSAARADPALRRAALRERVQILGHGSLVLFLANRRSATRFSETTAALDPRYGRGGKDREEILARLRQDPPLIIVVAEDQGQPQLDVAPTPRQIADFPPLAKFLEENYSPDEMVGHYKVLVLTARAQRGSSGAPRGAAR